MKFTTTRKLTGRLAAKVRDLRGRPGVSEAKKLLDRVLAAAVRHERQLAGNCKSPRTSFKIAAGQRRRAAVLADAAAGYPSRCFGFSPEFSGDTLNWPLKKVEDLSGGGVQELSKVNGWFVSTKQDETREWSYYSKGWHRQHGPKVTINSRTVLIRRWNPETREVEKRDQQIEAWRGNWALNALISARVIEAVKVPTKLRPVQLHPAYAVELHRQHGDLTVYRRCLAGDVIDFCALWHGLTFHAASPRAAVHGLREKLAAAKKRRNSPINWELCKELGFCDEGIKQFCRDFDLSPKGSYSPDEILYAVKRDIHSAEPYANDLRTLARAVGYPIPANLAA